jgi:uncharacterized protein YodC (DUF2158 family)
MADIKPGMTVRVKSGGPKMTVARLEEVNGHQHAICSWFTEGKNPKKETSAFQVVTLEIVE